MRCKQCEYTLWNLPTRTCPECGGGFLPSDYEFAPNAVQFCCPHCSQPYYGTDEKGHLVPRAFQCVKCHAPVDMDQMVLRPAAGVKDDGAMRDVHPWLSSGQRGFFGRWFATIGRSLVFPGRLGRSIPPERPAGQAWWFATITAMITSVLSIGPICLFFGGLGVFAGGGGGGGGAVAMAGPMVIGMLGLIAVAFGGTLVLLGLWGALSHWLLTLVKGANRPIGHTYAAIGYASGANLLTAVPCVGSNGLGIIWWIVSSVLTLKEAQQTTGGKATFAAITPPIVLMGLFMAGYMAVFFAAMSASMTMRTMGPTVTYITPAAQAQSMNTRLLAYAGRNRGLAPAHGLQLLDATTNPVSVWPSDFIAQSTATTLTDVWIPDPATGGSATLDDYFSLLPLDRANVSVAVSSVLPPGTSAHRVGDFVFTGGNLSLSAPNADLWLLVMCDDPDLITGVPALDPVPIGLADGCVIVIPRAAMADRLAKQNELRLNLGLPALPDPLTLRQFRPDQP